MSPAELLRGATGELARAGVETPSVDARLLLAHALGIQPSRLVLIDDVDDQVQRRLAGLVAERARRVPLQHLTGSAAFRQLELWVGPGVFVPRPETEVMTGWAIEWLRGLGGGGLVVDLCSGSGAIAKAIATEVTGSEVHAVELDQDAAAWAARNLAGTDVDLVVADMAGALPELAGRVDLVIANPPYIPLDAYPSVAPEARDHDPALALFSGGDGLTAIRILVGEAARLLRDGGLLCFEHADAQGQAAPAVVVACEEFLEVRDHPDLAGRPRFVTALRRRRAREPLYRA